MDTVAGKLLSAGELPGRGIEGVAVGCIKPDGGISTTGEMTDGSAIVRGSGGLGTSSGIVVAGFVIAKGPGGITRAGGGGDTQLGAPMVSSDRRATAALVGGLVGPIFMRASGLGWNR